MGAVKPSDSSYENARNHRVEENKKRLQELGLPDLSKDLSNCSTPSKSPTLCRHGNLRGQREKVKVQLRRSTRNSGGPQPNYVEVEIDIRKRARFDNTGGTRHYSRLYERKYASEEARTSATEKAEAIKKDLPPTNVSFVKPMLQSHVTGGFWLGLPVAFCRDHLPKKDDRIVLEDESNDEWETIYLANKTGLSGGWRGFSLDHGLVDGDALVFELVEPHRFKVHIVRVYGSNAATGEEEQEEPEEETKDQAIEGPQTGSSNRVRQRLIWQTKDEDIKEGKEPKRKQEEVKLQEKPDAGIDVKAADLKDLQSIKGSTKCPTVKIKLEADKETNNVNGGDKDVKLVKTEVEEHDPNRSKMVKDLTCYMKSKKQYDNNATVKKEMQSGTNGIKVW